MPPESQEGGLSTLSPAGKPPASKPGAPPASASAKQHGAPHALALPPPVGSVLELVGNTPILKVSDRFDTGCW
jgi:hypothetical protein